MSGGTPTQQTEFGSTISDTFLCGLPNDVEISEPLNNVRRVAGHHTRRARMLPGKDFRVEMKILVAGVWRQTHHPKSRRRDSRKGRNARKGRNL